MRLWFVVVPASVLLFASCDSTEPNPAPATVSEEKPTAPAVPVQSPKPCEQRFTPIGTALTRAAMDTRTGQQCRTAENAPPAFKSLPMCLDLSRKDNPSAVRAQSSAKPCEQRFTPMGMALTRLAMDTKTGQLCRTAENAPPLFQSVPMCSDLLSQFPD